MFWHLKITFQFLKPKTSCDIEVFENLLEKKFIGDVFLVFDDAINKAAPGKQIMHQSPEPVNYFINRHHFTMGIAGPNFNCMPFLGLEMLGGRRHICFFCTSVLTLASFLGLFACTQRVKEIKKDKIT